MVNKPFTCNVDKRRFPTKAALEQHKKAVHVNCSQPPKARRPRSGRGRRNGGVSRNGGSSRVVSGSDNIGATVDISTKSEAGSILRVVKMTPSYFTDSRMAAEASLWTRWRPIKMVLHILPSAGALTSGSYVVGFTYGHDERVVNGESAVHMVSAMKPSVSANVHKATTFRVPVDTSRKWYFTSPYNEEDAVHGTVFIVLSAPVGNITEDSKFRFNFKLDWTVAFEGAVLPTLGTAPGGEEIFADDGWEGYHTTSTNDWANGTRLTLKQHAGGELVPFSMARTNTLYELNSKASLTYYTAEGRTGKITHGVIIPELGGKHMAVFPSKSTAQTYLKSKSINDCTPYHSAGSTITPENPPWREIASAVALKPPLDPMQVLESKVDKLMRLLAGAGISSTADQPPQSPEFESKEGFCLLSQSVTTEH